MEYLNKKFNLISDNNPTTFRHFKGGLYQIICIGKNTENEEDLVVYKSLKDNKIWIRPANMFFSKVEDNKYPEYKNQERFQIINE